MRRSAAVNGLVVAAVVAVAGVAVADAVHGRSHGGPEAALRASAEKLAAAKVTGTLYVVDRSCRLRAFALPDLATTESPAVRACSAAVASRPLSAASWSLWKPGSRLVAWCSRRRVLVRAERGPTLPFIHGCAPAWAPDGSLTFVREGSVVRFPAHGRAEVILRRGAEGAARRIVWLGDDLVSAGGHSISVRGGAVQTLPGPVSGLWTDARGSRLALRSGKRVLLFDRALRLREMYPAWVEAVGWSPDGRWIALAGAASILVRRAAGNGVSIRIPLGARDLAWR